MGGEGGGGRCAERGCPLVSFSAPLLGRVLFLPRHGKPQTWGSIRSKGPKGVEARVCGHLVCPQCVTKHEGKTTCRCCRERAEVKHGAGRIPVSPSVRARDGAGGPMTPGLGGKANSRLNSAVRGRSGANDLGLDF